MKNMFEAADVGEIKGRLEHLKPEGQRLWGTMNAAQAIAHCSAGIEMATGDINPPRALIGRILGPMIKSKALSNDEPMRRNSPTSKELVVHDKRDFEAERQRLYGLIDRFYAAGPQACTAHPHPFFGPMLPEQWAILMYKHLDHHLRQFGV
jgi:uncharacterized protein DUF1569